MRRGAGVLCAACVALAVTAGHAVFPVPAAAVRETVVVVRPGDHLLSLARRWLERSPCYDRGELAGRLRQINGLESDTLHPGQRLRVPLRLARPANRPLGRPRGFAAYGIYLPARLAGSQAGRRLILRFAAVGGNTVVFDAKDRLGRLGFTMSIPLAQQIGANAGARIQQPAKLIEFLHEHGLQAVARVVCFYDTLLARVRPDLAPWYEPAADMQDGEENPTWVDPSLSEVQEYLLAVIDRSAALGLDEIQLDYVRFPTGNTSAALWGFDPDSLSREQIITGFVRRVRKHLDGTGVRLSAALFGVTAWDSPADAASTGQRLSALLPYLDVVCPMLYPSHFSSGFQQLPDPAARPCYIVYEGCRRVLAQASGVEVVVRPWLQAFSFRVPSYGSRYVARQMRGARAGGATGWLLWNPAGRYEAALEALMLEEAQDDAARGGQADSGACPPVESAPRAGQGR